jgi:c-di-GMP-binding flagellar brake protein YcgR
MERRRHKRIYLSLPIKFRIQLPENQEISWVNSGVLKNISAGGVFFVANDTPPLEPGQVRNFTISPADERLGLSGKTFIEATCRVVRMPPPRLGGCDLGVALEILSGTLCDMPIQAVNIS